MKKHCLFVILIIVSGLIGGAISNYIFMAKPAMAQRAKSSGNVVRARQFQLEDNMGNTVALFGASSGFPALELRDSNGTQRIFLGIVPDNDETKAFMKLNDKDGVMRIYIDESRGRPRLAVCDKTRSRAVIGCTETIVDDLISQKTESSLALYGETGNVIWNAP